MRRQRTDFTAIGAILAGAVIGVGGTMAVVGSPFEGSSAETLDCSSVRGSADGEDALWLITVSEDGERRVKRCPRRAWRVYSFQSFRPSRLESERETLHRSVSVRDSEEALESIRVMQEQLEEQARTMARERSVVVHYSR